VTGEERPAIREASSPGWNWWRFGDALVLLTYSAVVLWTLRYHEKWADEAQAWLIARDLDLRTIWFHELRYEGSPGLWHTILWIAQHVFHAGYGALGYIGVACAIAGAAFVLFAIPFPRFIRWPFVFSFFLVYQYAVIARSYVLFPFAVLLAACTFRHKDKPLRFAASLLPLACLTAHGTVVAGALSVVYFSKFVRQWQDLPPLFKRKILYVACMLCGLFLTLFLVLLPAADVEATHDGSLTLATIVSRSQRAIKGALFDNLLLSNAAFLVFAYWCYQRKVLSSFLLPICGVIGLYVYVDGWAHQLGTIFLAMVAGLCIAWPSPSELSTEVRKELWGYKITVITLVSVLCYQIFAAIVVIRRDVSLPYSGAEDAAHFLQPAVATGRTIYGYQYGMVAISANFEQKVFANHETSYYHHSTSTISSEMIAEELVKGKPDYVVFTWWDPWDPEKYSKILGVLMWKRGYSLVHSSDGFVFTKTGWDARQIYLIFENDTIEGPR
jgi:hypothetical protein